MAAEQRLAWLDQRLAAAGAVTVAEASDALAVSEMTIRRDLVELEERGRARRVRGGATAVGPIPFAERTRTASRAKARIAAKLEGLLPASGTVAFDASSTVMRLAGSLGHARDLTVVTNGPDTFQALQGIGGVEVLLTGGRLDPRTGSLVGPLARWSAEQLAVDVLFTSAAAVDARTGTLEATLEEAEVKRALASGAGRTVLAVDAGKLAGAAPALGLRWDVIDLLVTDLDPTDRRLEPFAGSVEIC